MERLSGVDAAFLSLETRTNHMHVGVVALLDPSTVPGGAPGGGALFGAVRAVVASRLHLLPLLRCRVVSVPFGLGHPAWADDASFDLDDHLRRAALPAPGGEAELAELAAEEMARPLERDRPLWEMLVVEGLEDGHAAVVAKVHHAAVDGMSGAAMLVRLLDLEPEPAVVAPEEAPWQPGAVPSEVDLVTEAVPWLAERPQAVVQAVRRTAEAVLALRRRNQEAGVTPPPAPFSAPRTSLNVAVTPRRRVAFARLPLGQVRAVKQAFSCTVNDVVLAVCSSALRAELAERGERPDGDLVALVPAASRAAVAAAAASASGAGGPVPTPNALSPLLVSLATTVEDPVQRLGVIAASSRAAKAQEASVGAGVLWEWAEALPPAVTGAVARLASSVRWAERLPPPANVVVSNVPGPPFPLYLAGARVASVYPLGPVVDGLAVNLTVASYLDQVHVGLVADRSAAPRLDRLADRLGEGLAELAKVAGEGRPPEARC